MFFPSNLIVALVSAFIYIIICFKLDLPEKYRKKIRIYSIIVQVSFIAFLVFFSLFIHSTQDNSGLVFFSYGLDIFYTLIALPLLTVLIYLISKWFMTLNDYPILIRYIILGIVLTFLIGLTFLCYIAFFLIFYGFAP